MQNDLNKSGFDAYELIGVVAPGSLLLFGLAALSPDLSKVLLQPGLSVGQLGLFLILSFIAGHLMNALAEVFEQIVWYLLGGLPTDWLLAVPTTRPGRLLNASQLERLQRSLAATTDRSTAAARQSIVRALYAEVAARGAAKRIDAFNRTYGLMRGVACAFLLLAAASLIMPVTTLPLFFLLLAASALATWRMIVFGKFYARELFTEYVRLMQPPPAAGADTKTSA